MRRLSFVIMGALSLCGGMFVDVAVGEPIQIKLATVAPTDTPWHNALLKMQKAVKEQTGGESNLRLFMGGQLGGELEIMDGLRLGTLELAAISTVAAANTIPELILFDLPFLWNSSEESYYVLDNILLPEINKILADKGLVALGWSENGWRHFMSREKPIRTLEDLRGFKVRSAQNRYHLAFWKEVGANARPISVPEIFQALQTGQIDGLDNTLIFTTAAGWIENLQHVTLSYHMYQPAIILATQKSWNGWPTDLRKTLSNTALELQRETRAQLSVMEPELIGAIKAMGVNVWELSPEERGKIRAAAVPIRERYRKEFGGKLLDLIEKGKREFARRSNR